MIERRLRFWARLWRFGRRFCNSDHRAVRNFGYGITDFSVYRSVAIKAKKEQS